MYFATEFGNFLYILVDIGNRSTGRHGYFSFGKIFSGYFEIIETKIGNHSTWKPPFKITECEKHNRKPTLAFLGQNDNV